MDFEGSAIHRVLPALPSFLTSKEMGTSTFLPGFSFAGAEESVVGGEEW